MSQDGFMVISDITGYTAYLSESELEHAEDSLRSLLNLLLDLTKPPLVISRLEGDAVISYAPQGSFLQGQTLVESIEGSYLAFRQARERMVLNTTCTCNACSNIPSLDLKFFVHYGTFMLQQLGSHLEMVGNDVNLIHRLTKNGVTEEIGLRAYAMYTQAAVDALDIGEICECMTPQTEHYEHIGNVNTYVQDMHAVWTDRRDDVRSRVTPEDAVFTIDWDFPLEQALMWDYITKPEHRAVFMGSGSDKVTGRSDGRTGPGTTYHCAHGKSVSLQTVVDWQPFDGYTFQTAGSFKGSSLLFTVLLTSIEGGTRISCSVGKSTGPLVSRMLEDLMMRFMARRFFAKRMSRPPQPN